MSGFTLKSNHILTEQGFQAGYLTVEDGKITKLEGDPDCAVSDGRVCERMDFQIEWLDHPKRCNYPLKRVGDRGSGKWERITWDEAYDEIEAKVREAMKAPKQ